jgi:outer membrane receptor protein involved in Fe transport
MIVVRRDEEQIRGRPAGPQTVASASARPSRKTAMRRPVIGPWIAMAAALILMISPVICQAALETVVVEIESQPLADLLKTVAELFDLQILFFPEDVEGIQAPALRGEYTANQAFTILLEHSALEHRFTGEDSVVISRRHVADPQPGTAREEPREADAGPEDDRALPYGSTAIRGLEPDGGGKCAPPHQPGENGSAVVKDGRGVFIGEFVVTAQKREQELQDVPFSILAFDAATLDDTNIRDLSELITFVPGASEDISYGAGQRSFQLRGIATGAGDPTVGYYIDDTAFFGVGQGLAPIALTFDIDRIEVLQGPQGTLYGNGSMGGTIRFITKSPDLSRFEAKLRAQLSTTEGGDPGSSVDAVANVPIVPGTLGLRLVASTERIGGYAEIPRAALEDTNPADLTHARASLLWAPTERIVLRFQYAHSSAKQDGSLLLSSRDPPISIQAPGDYLNWEYDLFYGTLEYAFDFATLISTTSSIDGTWDLLYNLPSSLAPDGILEFAYQTPTSTVNNETRLVSRTDRRWQWMVGVFYSDSEVKRRTETNTPDSIPSSESLVTARSVSLFGEFSWQLMDGKLVPLVGLRAFEDERAATSTSLEVGLGPFTFHDTAPRFGLSYLPTAGSNYYFNVAKGFRSGSFNTPGVCEVLHAQEGGLPCELTVPSDELWSYEVGVKRVMASGQLFVEGALYYQDWRGNRQSVAYSGIGAAYQVGDAAIPGIDVGLSYTPESARGLTVQANANWNDAHFIRLDPAISAVTGVEPGDRLPAVPEWTASVTANYQWSLTPGWIGKASVGYSHLDAQPGQFGSSAVGDNRNLLRAHLGWSKGSFGVSLFAKNLLNEAGAISVETPVDGLPISTRDYPRQVGLEITYGF